MRCIGKDSAESLGYLTRPSMCNSPGRAGCRLRRCGCGTAAGWCWTGTPRRSPKLDLGLAIGSGTDVAIEASDLTLVRGDLRAAGDAIRLARRTLQTIKGNLFWAFAYNIAALPLAAAGLLNPMICRRGHGLQLDLRRDQQPAAAPLPGPHRCGPRSVKPM
jgi:hypothetical protein